jgi:hypothetical protein
VESASAFIAEKIKEPVPRSGLMGGGGKLNVSHFFVPNQAARLS